jgi:hypothetical protein
MAELADAIYSRLTGFAGLSALVVSRVYPVNLPQNPAVPAVTYQKIGGESEQGMAADHGMTHPLVQFDCFAATYSAAWAVARQVRNALERWSGSEAGVTILDTLIEREGQDIYEDDVKLFRVSMDYTIWHRDY